MKALSEFSPSLDKYAISASALCAIHCLTLPLLLTLSPSLGSTILGQEAFHQLLLWLVVPLSMLSLSLGCKQHKDMAVAIFGTLGLITLLFTGIWGHDVLGESGEKIATLVGAATIAGAHIRNFTLCRRKQCEH